MADKGKIRSLFINLSLSFTVLLTLLLLSEFVVLPRFVDAPSRGAFLLGLVGPAGKRVGGVAINSMGFTADTPAVAKPPGTIRVLTLGGSSLFNRRLSERLLKSLSGASAKKVELLGAALRDHNTMSSVIKYRYLSKYQFDYVLIYHGINDLNANNVPMKDFSPDYSHFRPWYKRNFFLDNSVIARLVYNKFLYKRPPYVRMGAGFSSERVFGRNIEDLVESVRKDGGTPILMTFAWSIPANYTRLGSLKFTLGYNNPEFYNRCPVELWGPPNYIAGGLRRHNAVLRRVAKKLEVDLIDQATLLGKDLAWFGDVCHLSEDGTDEFIGNIRGYMTEHGFLR